MSSQITYVPDKPTHDAILAASTTQPTILYLSSSVLPACKAFTPQYEALAAKEDTSGSHSIKFCQMEYDSNTSPMFKFAQAQLPVVILLVEERWCRTLLSPSVREVEAGLEELKGEAEELLWGGT